MNNADSYSFGSKNLNLMAVTRSVGTREGNFKKDFDILRFEDYYS